MKPIIRWVSTILLLALILPSGTVLAAAPDLIIESISWSPENPSKGDTVTISVTVKNQGDGKALPSQLDFYLDDASKFSQDVPSLEAGDFITADFTWIARQGSHVIKMIVDKENWILESDETNNEKSLTISSLTPELIIPAITWSPSAPSVGDNVTFTITVKNQGEGRAANPVVAFYVDDTWQAAKVISSLEPAAEDTATFSWIALADSHSIKSIVDPANLILESDESNNEKIADFPSLFPDLVVQSITWSPTAPSVGDTVTFSVTFKNQGKATAASSRFYFYIGGLSSGTQNVPGIATGNSVTETFTWTAEAGEQKVRVIIDAQNRVTESNESNNEMITTFSGTKVPDIVVQSVTWSPENPSVGETITFLITVANIGKGRAGSSYISYYVDDNRLASARIDSMEPGDTRSKTFTWTVQKGYHRIKVVVDSSMSISESNEDNNEKEFIYPVPSDLTVKAITLSPPNPRESDNVTFIVSIENQGGSKADGFNIGYYIDDTYLGFVAAKTINPGTTENSTFTWVALRGSHSVKVVADVHNNLLELNENNNEEIMSFTVGKEPSAITEDKASSTVTPPASSTPGTEMNEAQAEVTEPITTKDGENKTRLLLYSLLGVGGFILIAVIFDEFWRRRNK